MYKILQADKDAYITNRVISGERVFGANVGAAGSLDLFKLYGRTMSGSVPNVELSRLLVHFDLTPVRSLMTTGRLSPAHPTFSCRLVLRDVYGGQPTPSDFYVSVAPLSKSFDEGLGRDIVQYSDSDACNYLTATRAGDVWTGSGCTATGSDYLLTHGSMVHFTTGFEDLEADVTTAVSATLMNEAPDAGFRIALSDVHENDTSTYFVKRFASRHAFDKDYHPALVITFDDSTQDDTQLLQLDEECTLFLYNSSKGSRTNIRSGSLLLTGSNCLALKLVTEVSGGFVDINYLGSQHALAGSPVTGVYSATFTVSSSHPTVALKVAQSGTLRVTPVWGSLDGTVGFLTGSQLTIPLHSAVTRVDCDKQLVVSCPGLRPDLFSDEELRVRVNVFDPRSQLIFATRRPVEAPGLVIRESYYSIRDVDTGRVRVPFETTHGATRLSSDSQGMWFMLDCESLIPGRRYVIDIMMVVDGEAAVYPDASPTFRVKVR